MKNTIFLDEVIKQGSTLKDIENIILNYNKSLINKPNFEIMKIKYKSIKKIVETNNIKIEVLSIDNNDIDKLTKGVETGRGQHKYYQITNITTNTKKENKIILIELYNYYGWVGNAEPYKTLNMLKIIMIDNKPYIQNNKYSKEIVEKINKINKLKDTLSIREIEKELKKIYGINTLNKVKKYKDIYDFIENNIKLFNKYIKEILGNKIFYFNYNIASSFDNSITTEVNYQRNKIENTNIELISSTELHLYIDILRKKINKKIQRKVTTIQLSLILKNNTKDNKLDYINIMKTTIKNNKQVMLMIFDEDITRQLKEDNLLKIQQEFEEQVTKKVYEKNNIKSINVEFILNKDKKIYLKTSYLI